MLSQTRRMLRQTISTVTPIPGTASDFIFSWSSGDTTCHFDSGSTCRVHISTQMTMQDKNNFPSTSCRWKPTKCHLADSCGQVSCAEEWAALLKWWLVVVTLMEPLTDSEPEWLRFWRIISPQNCMMTGDMMRGVSERSISPRYDVFMSFTEHITRCPFRSLYRGWFTGSVVPSKYKK